MAVMLLSNVAMSAMKMMRLQPARRPCVPMKILRRVDFLTGASCSW